MDLSHFTSQLPQEGLHGKSSWLFSPRPLVLSKRIVKQLKGLGHLLSNFQRASHHLYLSSSQGKITPWLAQTLDMGKPSWLLDQQRSKALQGSFPRILRPDLLLGVDAQNQEHLSLCEIDGVPGGLGITHFLSTIYAKHGFEVLGGNDGILKGFLSLFDNQPARILLSQESADYAGEMRWLASQCPSVEYQKAENAPLLFNGRNYRFFEWFDWQNIPHAQEWAKDSALCTPCKPHLEEKLWLALLHTPSLQLHWKKLLRANHLQRLQDIIPYSWVIDPTPLPPHASLPNLNIHRWEEIASLSQGERHLVIKNSGFSPLCWGSRGVFVGHDLPESEWHQALHQALKDWGKQGWLMQRFAPTTSIKHPYFHPQTGKIEEMEGRVRLTPYYFTNNQGVTSLGGILATIVPIDKKKIHGMSDAILVSCSIK